MFLESAIIPDAFQDSDMESYCTAADNNYQWIIIIHLLLASDISCDLDGAVFLFCLRLKQ